MKGSGENMEKSVRPFGIRDKIGYLFGDFGCNMSFSFINSYMMVFFVTCLNILPKHYAVIIIVCKVWDAINDPIIGGICDSAKPGKSGKFKPWIKWGSIPLLLASIIMFIYIPDAPYALRVTLCVASYFVWSVAYTSVNVPYGSLQSVITTDSIERAELSNSRSIGAMLAQAPAMILLPLIVYDSNDQPIGERFILVAGIMALIGVFAFQITVNLVTERVQPKIQQKQKFNYAATLKAFLTNRPMMALTISTVAYLSLIMTATNSLQYLFMLYFKNTKLISVAAVLIALPMLLAVALVKPLVKRYSKKVICTYPFIISIIATGIMTFVRFTNPYVWLVVFAIGMMATGFYMVLIWAMVADCIDYQEKKTGRREESSIYATYSFFRKLSQGIGSAIVSLAIGWAGYINENGANQAPEVAGNVYFAVGFLPFIGSILCFVSMLLIYNIDEKKENINEREN